MSIHPETSSLPDISDPTVNLHGHCPLCGSNQFDLRICGGDKRFVNQNCSVCGLNCHVVIGPESLPAEARLSEWAAVFAHD